MALAGGEFGGCLAVSGAQGGEDCGDPGIGGLAVFHEAGKFHNSEGYADESEENDGPDPEAAFTDEIERVAAEFVHGSSVSAGGIEGKAGLLSGNKSGNFPRVAGYESRGAA